MSHVMMKHDAALLAALRLAAFEQSRRGGDIRAAEPPRAATFVTISRQAGTRGRAFAKQLAARLNAIDPGGLPWTTWDNELVEKVASEHYVAPTKGEPLDDEKPSWFEECLAGLALSELGDWPDEFKVYHSVAVTIRALAEMGRVIIVGRGAAFITRDMPGGVHVRLIAPLKYREESIAEHLTLSPAAATAAVLELDRGRDAFYKRHWPKRPLSAENFTTTLNAAAIPAAQLVDCVLPLLQVGVSRVPSGWFSAPSDAALAASR